MTIANSKNMTSLGTILVGAAWLLTALLMGAVFYNWPQTMCGFSICVPVIFQALFVLAWVLACSLP